MATTAINIAATSTSGKKLSKAIADINPSASNSALQTFSTMLNGLTTNTIGTVTKITKEELGNEEPETPATNPVQSVTSYNATVYTVSGSGTAYNVTVNISELEDELNNDGTMGYGVYVGVQLPSTFDTKVYNNKVSVKYGTLSIRNNGSDNPGIDLYPIPGNKICLYVGTITPSLGTGTINADWNVTVQFDSVTVDDVKYAPWSVTFTLAE